MDSQQKGQEIQSFDCFIVVGLWRKVKGQVASIVFIYLFIMIL